MADSGAELVVCAQLMMELAMDEQPLSYGAVEAETLQANLAGFDRYLLEAVPADEALDVCGALMVGTLLRMSRARRTEALEIWIRRVQASVADLDADDG